MGRYKIKEKQINSERKRIFDIYNREDGVDAPETRKKIQVIMENFVGVIRRGEGLCRAIDELERINRDETPYLTIKGEKNYRMLGKALESINFIYVGKMIAKAALMRMESRGAHYREDLPDRDDENWLKNIIIRLDYDKIVLDTRPATLINLILT